MLNYHWPTRLLLLCTYLVSARAQIDCNVLKRAVVKVEGVQQASGIIVHTDGATTTILTVYHAVKGAPTITTEFSFGAGALPAKLLSFLEPWDLALLQSPVPVRVTTKDGKVVQLVAPMFKNDTVSMQDAVSIIGHPTGLSWQCYTGTETVTRLDSDGDAKYFLFSNPMVQPGLSGAPLFNDDGELIGMALGRAPSGNGRAIRITQALFGVKWPVQPNLVYQQANPNRMYNLRVVSNTPSSVVFDVDYNFESFRQLGSGSIYPSLLSSGSPIPDYSYSPGQMNDVAGTVRVALYGKSGSGTTTGVRLCMSAKSQDVACKSFPYRKVWATTALTQITSIAVSEDLPGRLQLRVDYRYGGDLPFVTLLSEVRSGQQIVSGFTYPNLPMLTKGAGVATLTLAHSGTLGIESDSIQLCIVGLSAQANSNVDLSSCRTYNYRKRW